MPDPAGCDGPAVVPGGQRVLGGDFRGIALPFAAAGRPGGVRAFHGVVDGVAVFCRRVLGRHLGEQFVVVVAEAEVGECLGQRGPVALAVEGVEGDVGELRRAEHAARGLAQFGLDTVPGSLHLGAVRAEVEHPLVLGDPVEVLAQPPLRGDVLVEVVAVPDLGGVRVDRAVQDHPVHACREQLAVHRAQVGAVGVAEVADFLLAQRFPNAVHVLGVGQRVQVRQVLAGPLLAAVGVLLRTLPVLLPGVRRVRVGQRVLPVGRRIYAGDRGAVPGVAGVEADQVVGVQHLGGQFTGERASEGHARTARAAGVDQQRAPASLGLACGQLRDQQLQLLTVRRAIVQRHVEVGALYLREGPADVLRTRPELQAGRGLGGHPRDSGAGQHRRPGETECDRALHWCLLTEWNRTASQRS